MTKRFSELVDRVQVGRVDDTRLIGATDCEAVLALVDRASAGESRRPTPPTAHAHCAAYADIVTQVVIRLDPETRQALAHLEELTGQNRSDAVRGAIRAAERDAVLALVREQSAAVRDDPDDRTEMRAVADDLESLRAW